MTHRKYETLLIQFEGDFATLAVNRPDKLNALNQLVLQELKECLTALLLQKELKGLVFTGEGEKAFIAGADIIEMGQMNPYEAGEFSRLGQEVTELFERLPIPVVAAVHGFALGGGCEMAMACDFILATESAVFGQPEVKLGLIPGFGGTQRLAQRVGVSRAKELIFSGRNLKAAEAFKLGLVLELCGDKKELLERAHQLLTSFSSNSKLAIADSKQLVDMGSSMPLSQALEMEAKAFGKIFGTDDMKEGTQAFCEKRKPNFIGK